MIKIYTKFVRGVWVCYTTYNGYDFSEESETQNECREVIRQKLSLFGVKPDEMDFQLPQFPENPQKYKRQSPFPFGYMRNRIDNL